MNASKNASGDPQPRRLQDPLLTIVLPVFNELPVLAQLTTRLTETMHRCGVRQELIFVNDGSTDGSGRFLDQLARRSTDVKVIHLSRNFGHQAALQAGLSHAKGDAVVLMDCDMQDSPDAIVDLYAKWKAGYDVVYAVRKNRKENLFKRTLFAGFHRLLAAVSRTPVPVDAGVFGLIDRQVAQTISGLAEHDRYLPGLRSWVGFRQTGVAVERLPRYDRAPRVSMMGLFRLAKTAIFGFSNLPLAVFYLIGISALGVFAAVGGFALFCRLFTNLAIPGWTSYVLGVTFFGALNALGISMLGEYVTRIYDQVRGRPMYIVARTTNVEEQTPDAAGAVESLSSPRENIPDEISDLAATFTAYLDADLPDELTYDADAHVLHLLEEANSLLVAVSRGRSSGSPSLSELKVHEAGGEDAPTETLPEAGR